MARRKRSVGQPQVPARSIAWAKRWLPVVQLAAALGGLVKLAPHRWLDGVAAALKHLADGMISESDR